MMGQSTKEESINVMNGWTVLVVTLLGFASFIGLMVFFIVSAVNESPQFWALITAIPTLLASIFCSCGFFALQPNEATVITLFGSYVGTVRNDGFHWTNPFRTRQRISLRSRNFNSPTLKVNDLRGNPIEIGAVVVWKVEDSAQATFDVDNYRAFIEIQTESAVRQLASAYSYDDGEKGEITLRSGRDEVAKALAIRLQDRLKQAGVLIEEARISHLAYAPEIAQAMLRRQQAEAVIAARKKIVEGAVTMVEMALTDLAEKKVVHLDDERKAAMVSNLLVVLCSESEAQPVLNTGTLYN
ncbi:SPFH domain-containing protein [Pirellulaceae bacterium]|nr:SPFH domain-containing protein [Pirellulaceae bacterium]